jgi:Arc/MetJ family transcription regulator
MLQCSEEVDLTQCVTKMLTDNKKICITDNNETFCYKAGLSSFISQFFIIPNKKPFILNLLKYLVEVSESDELADELRKLKSIGFPTNITVQEITEIFELLKRFKIMTRSEVESINHKNMRFLIEICEKLTKDVVNEVYLDEKIVFIGDALTQLFDFCKTEDINRYLQQKALEEVIMKLYRDSDKKLFDFISGLDPKKVDKYLEMVNNINISDLVNEEIRDDLKELQKRMNILTKKEIEELAEKTRNILTSEEFAYLLFKHVLVKSNRIPRDIPIFEFLRQNPTKMEIMELPDGTKLVIFK